MKETEGRKYAASLSPTNFDGDAYPSPDTWRSEPSLSFRVIPLANLKGTLNSTSPCSRPWVQTAASYRFHWQVMNDRSSRGWLWWNTTSQMTIAEGFVPAFITVMLYNLIRDILTCSYFGSADIWMLRNELTWSQQVVCGKMLAVVGTMIKWNLR